MLKLYTNTNFLTKTYRKVVFPLLFDLVFKNNKSLESVYTLVDTVEASDIVVFPIDYVRFLKEKEAFNELQQLAKTNNKPIWIYTAGDYGFTNYIANSYTFRLGGFDSELNENTFILPSFINDPYSKQLKQGFSVLQKEKTPSVGFVGHAKSGFSKYIKELTSHIKYKLKQRFKGYLVDSQLFYPSSIKRAEYLYKLQLSKSLNTNFVLRENYRAGVQTEADKLKTTQEFYDNIFNNAYTFCSRGVGNFSVRFYETLAVGRIPIVLNTDCRFPLNTIIDWSKHCVILEENNEVPFEQQILGFHNSKSNDGFQAVQKNNRLLWETHLKRDAYFLKIQDIFLNKINSNA